MAKPPKSAPAAPQPPAGAIVGTEGADVIDGTSAPVASTPGDDVIWGLGGDDWIDAGGGNDTIEAGAGDDTIIGGAGNDIIHGGDGSDVIFDGAGSDIIDGGTGDGIDVVIYDGVEGVDYDVVVHTEIVGKGKNAQEVVTGFTVTALDGSGDVDEITNVDHLVFLETPQPGTIVTQGDFQTVQYDQTGTVDVLANDFLEGGDYGQGLTISAILDVQIDLDGDGVNDVDLIPDGADISYFTSGGLLNDGSILTLNPDNTLTWDPNGQYDTPPSVGDGATVITFWYEASDGTGATAYGDVTLQVSYPPMPGDIQFEDMVGVYDDFTAAIFGLWIYQDGPDGQFLVSQLTSADTDGLPFEQRDVSATSFDYDGDGDDEFRVWTDADGTTHEMNITRADSSSFDLAGLTLVGLDPDEEAVLALWDDTGHYAEVTVTANDLDANGVLEIANATNLTQFSVVAATGSNFYVDDVMIV